MFEIKGHGIKGRGLVLSIIVSAMVLLTGFLLLDVPDEYDAAIDDEFSVDGLEYSVLSEVGSTGEVMLVGGGTTLPLLN